VSDCACGYDGDWWDCVDGAVYGPCEDENCGGVCELKHDCGHTCHLDEESTDAYTDRAAAEGWGNRERSGRTDVTREYNWPGSPGRDRWG
jgi:hypothetical protein